MMLVLGAALVFLKKQDEIPNKCTLRLLFQPAEEGPGGAKPMIEEGAL